MSSASKTGIAWGECPAWNIYRAIYNDDSVFFIEAEVMKDARFVAERMGNEELFDIALTWTQAEILAGKNNIKLEKGDEGDVITFTWFGVTESHDLYNEASI